MTKYPKKLWALMWTSGSFSAYTDHKTAGNGSKRYHLHPGNELARALNIIRGDVWYYNLNTTDKDVAEDLRNNGIPIRWNEKKGKFV